MSAATLTNGTAEKALSQQIVITDTGPIVGDFVLDLSNGPGLYELRGGKGAGKSTTIRCIESLIAGHAVDLTVRDGQLGASISGFGRIVPIGSRKKTRGELDIDSLDYRGGYSVSDITDPPQQGAAPADAHRIKALASLCGVKPDPTLYYPLVLTLPGKAATAGELGDWTKAAKLALEKLIPAKELETDDPVLLANRIKRRLDEAARQAEAAAEHAMGHARGCEDSLAGIDLAGPCDQAELDAAADAAVMRETSLKAQAATAARAAKEVAAARENLRNITASYDGPTEADAIRALNERTAELEEANSQCAAIEAEIKRQQGLLRDALAVAKERGIAATAAKQAVESAEQHTKLKANCESLIASQAAIVGVPKADMLAAAQAVKDAREAQAQGVRIRDAQATKARQEKHLSESVSRYAWAEAEKRLAGRSLHVRRARQVDSAGRAVDRVAGGRAAPCVCPRGQAREENLLLRAERRGAGQGDDGPVAQAGPGGWETGHLSIDPAALPRSARD